MQHIIKFTFVHPEDYIDPEIPYDPDDADLVRVEDYDLRQNNAAPQLGERVEFNGEWLVTQIHSYHAVASDWQFYVAICTQDGIAPDRRDWEDAEPKTLVFYLEGERLAVDEVGFSAFAIGDRPWVSLSDAIVFKPANGRPIGGYDQVLAVQTSTSLVAA